MIDLTPSAPDTIGGTVLQRVLELLHTRKHRGSHKHGVRMDDKKTGILQLIEKCLFREEKRKAQKHARETDPRSRGAEGESLFRRPRQAGRIYPPHSAYALRVQLVCPIKDESSRRTDRPQPNTHQQEQQHFYPPEGQTRTLRELYKKTIFCIIRGMGKIK